MNREVRWIVQGRLKASDAETYWLNRTDVSYSGWFYSTGKDEPTDALKRDVEQARTDAPHMDFRVLQETRTFESEVLTI